MMKILEDKSKTDFPDMEPVSFEIRSVHKSMEEFLSPAFYLTPPLDTRTPNTIYINHGRSISNLELFTTLSHEGFPGHLYQTVYFGRKIHLTSAISLIPAAMWKAGQLMWNPTPTAMQQTIFPASPLPILRSFPG